VGHRVELQITGIAWSPRHPLAFISGRGVTTGDTIGGWTVAQITETRVTLTDEEGNQKQLDVYQQSGSSAESGPSAPTASQRGGGSLKAETNANY